MWCRRVIGYDKILVICMCFMFIVLSLSFISASSECRYTSTDRITYTCLPGYEFDGYITGAQKTVSGTWNMAGSWPWPGTQVYSLDEALLSTSCPANPTQGTLLVNYWAVGIIFKYGSLQSTSGNTRRYQICIYIKEDGVCGSAARVYTSTEPWPNGYGYCATGTANPTSPSNPPIGGSSTWQCSGVDGGNSVSCSASRAAAAAPINGACGTANKNYGLGEAFPGIFTNCSAGTQPATMPSLGSVSGSVASWNCTGSNGGTNATCMATRSYTVLGWKNLNGDDISVAQINDDVVLYFGTGISGNVDYFIRNATSVMGFGNSSTGFAIWKARAGNYTFNATNNSGATWYLSSPINVSALENNTFPSNISILLPVNGSKYSVNFPISFNQSAKDEDNLLNISWNYGNGSRSFNSNYSFFEQRLNGLGNTQVRYFVPGVYTIALSVNETGRMSQNRGVDYTSITVFQPGVNVIPIITSPAKEAVMGRMVFFNASQTYVVNCTLCTGCSGYRDNGFYTEDGGLNCTYLHTPGSNKNSNLVGYSLFFNWSLGDGNYRTGYWNSANYSGTNGVVEFLHRYSNGGQHNSRLKVTYSW